jgi:hypothetical protein
MFWGSLIRERRELDRGYARSCIRTSMNLFKTNFGELEFSEVHLPPLRRGFLVV